MSRAVTPGPLAGAVPTFKSRLAHRRADGRDPIDRSVKRLDEHSPKMSGSISA
jgi:hypothetical protein